MAAKKNMDTFIESENDDENFLEILKNNESSSWPKDKQEIKKNNLCVWQTYNRTHMSACDM